MNRCTLSFLLAFLSVSTFTISATEKEDNDLQTLPFINGQHVIFLDEATQKSSGLKTVKLQQENFQPEFIAYGKAISVIPLLAIREQYLSLAARNVNAKVRFNQAEKNISRLRDLHKNEIISTRKLQLQQTQLQSDKAAYDSSRYQGQIIINSSQLQWGEILTEWAIDSDSRPFAKLMTGKSTLLQLTLPGNRALPSQTRTIQINPAGDRNSAFKATLVSELPQVNSTSHGLQYLFLTENSAIKAGMNFTAWIPGQTQNQTGVIIPEFSLAWHLGQAFVFIKMDEEHFIHRNINAPVKVTNGYFITGQIADGEEIVITGTQMLLSHEFRSRIPDEDDD